MASFRTFLTCSVFCVGICLCFSTKQKASKLQEDNKPLVITNATRKFVEKVFKQYAENSTSKMTIQDFYQLLNALKIGQVYEVTGHVETLDRDSKRIIKTLGRRRRRRRSVSDQHETYNDNFHNQRFHNSVSRHLLFLIC